MGKKNQNKNAPKVTAPVSAEVETEIEETDDLVDTEGADAEVETLTNEEAQALVDSGEAEIPEAALVSKPKSKTPKVIVKKALVNMTLHNGKNLEIGKDIELTEEEYKTLRAHHLGPAIEA